MLYTRKGDSGTTKIFNCDQRFTKSAALAHALGSVDEANALLGVLKVKGGELPATSGLSFADMLGALQQDLFIVQAELAGADKHIEPAHVARLEEWIDAIERELPPINSFFVSGGTELAALSDFARTVVRRAERTMVLAFEERGEGVPLPHSLAYVNRASSLLYALARLANHRAGITEEKPHY